MIIVGYQGVGKSTVAKNANGFIDLESGNFYVNGVRDDNWYIVYCQIAKHLSDQGYNVFMSAHKQVRDELLKYDVKRKLVYPSKILQEFWIDRLLKRWQKSALEKDRRAYLGAQQYFIANINELDSQDGFEKIIIDSAPYDLKYMLK